MVQVQVRMAEKEVDEIDRMVEEGLFKSRSDAIRSIVKVYEHNQKVRDFYEEIERIDRETEENPERLIPIEEI